MITVPCKVGAPTGTTVNGDVALLEAAGAEPLVQVQVSVPDSAAPELLSVIPLKAIEPDPAEVTVITVVGRPPARKDVLSTSSTSTWAAGWLYTPGP